MAKIKVYRGIGADTQEELDKYIKEFYDKTIKAQGYGGGGNFGDGIYFTTDKNEAIAYSKGNDYKDWNYSHVFEVEIDTDDFLTTDKIDYDKLLELDSEYKRLNTLMQYRHDDDTYTKWIKAQDRALEKFVKGQNKKGITDGTIFNVQNKDVIFNTPDDIIIGTPKMTEAVKNATYWDKRALRRLSDADKISDAYVGRIKKIYEQAHKNIDREIARVYRNYAKDTGLDVQKLKELLTAKETDKVWKTLKRQGLDEYIKNNYKSRISRLEQVQAQIYAKAKQIYPKEELEQTMCYKGVINNSYYKAIYDTQMGTGYDFSFTKIDKNLMTAVLNEKWSGLNYSQRIWGNTDILADSLSQIVGGALLSGQSIQKTARQIDERFKVGKYYAERLVRTETNHFNNEADAMAYEEMGIEQYVFVATLDNRTSEKCQNLDGKIYNYKDKETGVNYPPLHPNCRSKTRGYLGDEAERTLKRRARNPNTGKTEIIDNMPYSEWIKQYQVETPKSSISKKVTPAKIQTKQKKWQDFNSIEDADRYVANRYDIGSSIIKIKNVEGANTVLKTLDDLEDKWILDKKICVDTKYMRNAGACANYRGITLNQAEINKKDHKAVYGDKYKKEIEKQLEDIKTNYLGNPAYKQSSVMRAIEQGEEQLKYNCLTIANGYDKTDYHKAIVSHEYGHILADQYFGQINQNRANRDFAFTDDNPLWQKCKLVKDVYNKALRDGDIYDISHYASTTEREFFAEIFCKKYMGGKLPKYIDDMLEEVLKK